MHDFSRIQIEMVTKLFPFASYVCTKLNGFAFMRFYTQRAANTKFMLKRKYPASTVCNSSRSDSSRIVILLTELICALNLFEKKYDSGRYI